MQRVIDLAMAQVGYVEKRDGNLSFLQDKKANAGSNNYTIFGYEMHKLYPSVMDYPAPWCDAFVDWCFYKAYGISAATALLGGRFDDYTVASAQLFANMGKLDGNPRKGDQIFFTRNGAVSGTYHTGLVSNFDGTTITAIEGNTNNGAWIEANGGEVCEKHYKLSDLRGRALYGHPDYDSLIKSEPIREKKSEKPEEVKMKKLKSNMTGKAVKIWQVIIGAETTGVFDLPTEKKTVKWKKEHGLDDSPTVGDKAWKTGLESLNG